MSSASFYVGAISEGLATPTIYTQPQSVFVNSNFNTAILTSYSTSFPLVENPLTQGGIWVRGAVEGVVWTNPKVTANGVVASVVPTPNRYSDGIAHLKKTFIDFADDQYVQTVVYKAGGYVGGGGSHEIEALLRFQITANAARGYEVLWGDGPSGPYMAFVRWNGVAGDYTAIWDSGLGVVPSPADGDVLRATIVGVTLRAYINGVLIHTSDVTTAGAAWTEGQPGVGFWPVDGATPENMGWKSFAAGAM